MTRELAIIPKAVAGRMSRTTIIILITIAVLAAVYAGIYLYQRAQINKEPI